MTERAEKKLGLLRAKFPVPPPDLSFCGTPASELGKDDLLRVLADLQEQRTEALNVLNRGPGNQA